MNFIETRSNFQSTCNHTVNTNATFLILKALFVHLEKCCNSGTYGVPSMPPPGTFRLHPTKFFLYLLRFGNQRDRQWVFILRQILQPVGVIAICHDPIANCGSTSLICHLFALLNIAKIVGIFHLKTKTKISVLLMKTIDVFSVGNTPKDIYLSLVEALTKLEFILYNIGEISFSLGSRIMFSISPSIDAQVNIDFNGSLGEKESIISRYR